jgi:hypothetical protein
MFGLWCLMPLSIIFQLYRGGNQMKTMPKFSIQFKKTRWFNQFRIYFGLERLRVNMKIYPSDQYDKSQPREAMLMARCIRYNPCHWLPIVWLSNLSTLSVPDEGYSRNLNILYLRFILARRLSLWVLWFSQTK